MSESGKPLPQREDTAGVPTSAQWRLCLGPPPSELQGIHFCCSRALPEPQWTNQVGTSDPLLVFSDIFLLSIMDFWLILPWSKNILSDFNYFMFAEACLTIQDMLYRDKCSSDTGNGCVFAAAVSGAQEVPVRPYS